MDSITELTATLPDAPRGYRKGVVTLWTDDYSAESRIPAYLPADGRTWNGWEVPVFPTDTFAAHRDAWQRLFPEVDDEESTVDWSGDVPRVVFHYEGEPDESEVNLFDIDGIPLYSVGAGMVWEEVEA
jgi:hypothetical protein